MKLPESIPLERPWTFSDEFSLPINTVRNFMTNVGFKFTCKYPLCTGELPFIPSKAQRIITHIFSVKRLEEPQFEEGIFEDGERGRYTHWDDINKSFDAVVYEGRILPDNENKDYNSVSIVFVNTGPNSTEGLSAYRLGKATTVKEFMDAIGFSKNLRIKENSEIGYKRYESVNSDGNEVWVTFYNDLVEEPNGLDQ